jgi:hypothetical protein
LAVTVREAPVRAGDATIRNFVTPITVARRSF